MALRRRAARRGRGRRGQASGVLCPGSRGLGGAGGAEAEREGAGRAAACRLRDAGFSSGCGQKPLDGQMYVGSVTLFFLLVDSLITSVSQVASKSKCQAGTPRGGRRVLRGQRVCRSRHAVPSRHCPPASRGTNVPRNTLENAASHTLCAHGEQPHLPPADSDALSHTPTAAHGVLGTRGSPNNPHKAKTPADWPLASSPYAVVKVPREMTSPLREMPSCWICELPGPGTHTGSSSKAGGPEGVSWMMTGAGRRKRLTGLQSVPQSLL